MHKMFYIGEDLQKFFFKFFFFGSLVMLAMAVIQVLFLRLPVEQFDRLLKTGGAVIAGSVIAFGVSNFLTRLYSGQKAQFLEIPFWVITLLSIPMWLIHYLPFFIG